MRWEDVIILCITSPSPKCAADEKVFSNANRNIGAIFSGWMMVWNVNQLKISFVSPPVAAGKGLNADACIGEESIQISAASDSFGWLLLVSICI